MNPTEAIKTLNDCWLDCRAILDARFAKAMADVFGATNPLAEPTTGAEGEPTDGEPPKHKTLISRVSEETGNAIMEAVSALGPVDDTTRDCLEKHCQWRFKVAAMGCINEAMGQQLVRDFKAVKAGTLKLSVAEDGGFRFKE